LCIRARPSAGGLPVAAGRHAGTPVGADMDVDEPAGEPRGGPQVAGEDVHGS
jgi:hypothetical protein